ncbi:MBL fold metallo-hydrolase [uncultured Acetatifactor sp.]|jgi:7,8-dihydropterin-6-yl-methyl-4-(beta-D-ribofuranosyl)aminobenzene 5'-phosphate synthase|uniref:MBL fold metallo-hydrolase n=1 Tax=uncultured Acetatifactor sp. TaxID=1671927 RepID=UPI0026084208|nr:MBL fold metallo-hydrolase [uncultured Acetatifactor sp.]
MRILNLIENTEGAAGCLCEHGLSFYIETGEHKILVDTGASGAFLMNAETLGIDLDQVDTVIISHGHYDHAGGLLAFAERNPKARIWINGLAGEQYYHKNDAMERYIGMDPRIKALPQVEWVEGDREIDQGIFLFGRALGRRLWPDGNRELKVKTETGFRQDDFLHEQYLVLEERGKRVLISGCAHNGILNILDRYREIYGEDPDVVISGFHMSRKSHYSQADHALVRDTARELQKLHTRFFTGHCTGELPYRILREIMGPQISYVHSGQEISLEDI